MANKVSKGLSKCNCSSLPYSETKVLLNVVSRLEETVLLVYVKVLLLEAVFGL